MARVLVIDDDFLVTHLLREHLTNEGHQVTAVQMAEEGFATAVKTSPDLIMLDVNLPDATGFQMCGRLRENPITRAIPIVMMTGAARFPNQQAIGRQMGANDYILKPFNVVEVGDRIKSLIHPKHDVRVIETGDKAPATPHQAKNGDAQPQKINLPEGHKNGNGASLVPNFESMTELFSPKSAESLSSSEIEIDEASAPSQTETMNREEPLAPAPETPLVAAMMREEPTSAGDPQADDRVEEILTDALRPRTSLWTFGVLFVVQLGLSVAVSLNQSAAPTDIVRNVTLICGGWALLLGLVVATCAFLQIELAPRLALQILSWAAVPIVLRSAGALVVASVPSLSMLHAAFDPAYLPTLVFWLRPLDIFEITAVVILGLSLRQRLGCSILKSLLAAAFIALAWSLAGRGYFQPF